MLYVEVMFIIKGLIHALCGGNLRLVQRVVLST